MRKVFFQMFVSADGFIDGPKGAWDIDWHVAGDGFQDYVNEMMESIDGILLGRKTYEGFSQYWATSTEPEAAAMNALPKIVFSRTLDKTDWNNSRLVQGDAGEEVARLKREAGKDLAIFGSNDLAASLAQQGLIDEFRLFLNPVILGGGTSLLAGVKDRISLKLMSAKPLWDGVVLLTYAPA